MLQVASFALPADQDKANAFLATHKPSDGGVSFNKDMIVVFWDDRSYPAEYQIADLEELLRSNRAAAIQQEVALAVAQAELVGLPTNLAQYDQLSTQIRNLENGIKLQKAKADFIGQRIDALRNGTDGGTGN